MMYKYIALLAILLAVLLCKVIYHNQPDIQCEAKSEILKGNNSFKYIVRYDMRNGQGLINLRGAFYAEGVVEGYVSRSISFHYFRSGDIYTLRSNLIARSPEDQIKKSDEDLWLAKFYREQDKLISYVLEPFGYGVWLFSTSSAPLYVCETS